MAFLYISLFLRGGGLNEILSNYVGVAYKKGAAYKSEYGTFLCFSPQEDLSGRSPARVFKVVFVGDSGVGKSSFIHRFCSDSFRHTFSATIGVDFQVRNVRVGEQVIAMQLWDTAGQERYALC